MSSLRDGVGHYAESLPELNAHLLEECIAWATWDQENRQMLADNPSYQKYLQNIPGWDQGSWSSADEGDLDPNKASDEVCKTTYCIAGYAAWSTGHVSRRYLTDQDEILEHMGYCSVEEAREDNIKIPARVGVDRVTGLKDFFNSEEIAALDDMYDEGAGEAWGDLGQRLLGLTAMEADRLFNGTNSLGEVQALAQAITKSRDLPPLNFDRWSFTTVKDEQLDELFTTSRYNEQAASAV